MDFINLLNLLIARIKKNRIISFSQPIVKLNIGSDLNVCDGWVNLDCAIHAFLSTFPAFLIRFFYYHSNIKNRYSLNQYISLLKNNIFIHHNAEYGLPFNDSSIDYIYSCHFLEHLNKQNGEHLLEETYRVLKVKGLIRLCIPDFKFAVDQYTRGNKEAAVDFIFASEQTTYLNTHKYMYDYDMLANLLKKIGFTSIEKYSYAKGNMLDIKGLEKYPDTSIFVEASK